MPDITDKEAILAVLKPIIPISEKIIRQSWSLYMQLIKEYPPFRYPRTKANLLWDWITTMARSEFDEVPNIKPLEQEQTVWFKYDDSIIFRFKKSNTDGYSRNFPTQAAIAYHNQQIELEGFPQIIRIEFVYIPNMTETDLEDIRVVCRNEDQIAWQESIMTSADVIHIIPEPEPTKDSQVEAKEHLKQKEEESTKDK